MNRTFFIPVMIFAINCLFIINLFSQNLTNEYNSRISDSLKLSWNFDVFHKWNEYKIVAIKNYISNNEGGKLNTGHIKSISEVIDFLNNDYDFYQQLVIMNNTDSIFDSLRIDNRKPQFIIERICWSNHFTYDLIVGWNDLKKMYGNVIIWNNKVVSYDITFNVNLFKKIKKFNDNRVLVSSDNDELVYFVTYISPEESECIPIFFMRWKDEYKLEKLLSIQPPGYEYTQ